jgi:hypothetical protein
MADYYPLMSRAIAALDKRSKEARRVLYDRARATLADQLRKVEPPLSETDLEHERLALEDAIGKVEADAILSEVEWPIPGGLRTQSNDGKSGSNSQQTQPADDHLEQLFATVKATAPPDAKLQRERRFAFWGLLIVSVLWIGYLFSSLPTFSTWYDWLVRLGQH